MADAFKATIAILGLLLVVAFGAWLVVARTGLFAGSAQQTDPQRTTTPAPASGQAIPRLDAAVPAETETAGAGTAGAGTAGAGTATFALG